MSFYYLEHEYKYFGLYPLLKWKLYLNIGEILKLDRICDPMAQTAFYKLKLLEINKQNKGATLIENGESSLLDPWTLLL